MKITFVYDNVYPHYVGGVEKRIWETGRRLADRGHEIHWYCMKYWDGPDVIYDEGVWFHGVCPPLPLFKNGRRSIKEAIYFAWKVFIPLLKEKYHVIEVQNFPYFPVFTAKLCSIFRGNKLVVTWHEVWGKYWFEYLGKIGVCGLIIERLTAFLSQHKIAVSESTKKDLEQLTKKPDIKVIPNGIDFNSIHNIDSNGEEVDVIYAGRLIKEKGVHLLIEAIDLIKETKRDISCLIIGDGPEKENIYSLIHDFNLQNNVQLASFYEDYNDLISQIKSSCVFVLPSMREGFGIVVLEANSSGVPVITTEHHNNAAKDLISNGINGYTSQCSADDLAQKILSVVNSSGNWHQSCIACAKNYDWEQIVDSLEKHYLKLIEKNKKQWSSQYENRSSRSVN